MSTNEVKPQPCHCLRTKNPYGTPRRMRNRGLPEFKHPQATGVSIRWVLPALTITTSISPGVYPGANAIKRKTKTNKKDSKTSRNRHN